MHEIDMTTGRAAIAYAGSVPWHNLGSQVNPGAPVEEWQEKGGLNWSAVRTDVIYNGKDDDYQYWPEKHVLYRSDTGKPLSVVSKEYKTAQPADVLGFFKGLADKGGFEIETVGSLKEGRRIWALARVGKDCMIQDDKVAPYLMLATSYDGSMATIAQFTAVRIVCQNTLNRALRNASGQNSVTIPHSAMFKPDAVRLEFGIALDSWDEFMIKANKLAARKITDPVFDGYVVAPVQLAKTITGLFGEAIFEALKEKSRAESATDLPATTPDAGAGGGAGAAKGKGVVRAFALPAGAVRELSAADRGPAGGPKPAAGRQAESALASGWLVVTKEQRKGKRRGHEYVVTGPVRQCLQTLLALQAELRPACVELPVEFAPPLLWGRCGLVRGVMRFEHMSVRSFQARMKHWAYLAGLPDGVSPHWLRHTRGVNIIDRSRGKNPLKVVQEALGHQSIASSGIYTQMRRDAFVMEMHQVAGGRMPKAQAVAFAARVGGGL